jgi:phage baseplate assembly protein V
VGKIVETHSSGVLAKARILDRATDFLPVLAFANSYKRRYEPIREGEMVLIIAPQGEIDGGFLLRGSFHANCQKPDGANSHTEVSAYEDGTTIKYDTKAKKLDVLLAGGCNINITGDAAITIGGNLTATIANNADITAKAVTITADNVDIGKSEIDGIVTGKCNCMLLGIPHAFKSATVKAGM